MVRAGTPEPAGGTPALSGNIADSLYESFHFPVLAGSLGRARLCQRARARAVIAFVLTRSRRVISKSSDRSAAEDPLVLDEWPRQPRRYHARSRGDGTRRTRRGDRVRRRHVSAG